jgi:hypothetical protein
MEPSQISVARLPNAAALYPHADNFHGLVWAFFALCRLQRIYKKD